VLTESNVSRWIRFKKSTFYIALTFSGVRLLAGHKDQLAAIYHQAGIERQNCVEQLS